MKIGTNHSTKELLYTHIYWTSVEVIVLARILNQLVLQTVTSNGQMDWQNYPKSRKSIRPKHWKAQNVLPSQRREVASAQLISICSVSQRF